MVGDDEDEEESASRLATRRSMAGESAIISHLTATGSATGSVDTRDSVAIVHDHLLLTSEYLIVGNC